MSDQQVDRNDPVPVMTSVPRSKEEKIAFAKWWDRQVDAGKQTRKDTTHG